MTEPFKPYWLIFDKEVAAKGKKHGFATIDGDSADTAYEAIAVWKASDDCTQWSGIINWNHVDIGARYITKPFVS